MGPTAFVLASLKSIKSRQTCVASMSGQNCLIVRTELQQAILTLFLRVRAVPFGGNVCASDRCADGANDALRPRRV